MSTFVILNPGAGSQRAGKIWQRIQSQIEQKFGEVTLAITESIDSIPGHLEAAARQQADTLLVIGGDGTNHAVINALLQDKNNLAFSIAYGQIPAGTGCDFSRTPGIPSDPHQVVEWLANANPQPLDLGFLQYDDQSCYFLNIASAGIGGEVDRRVNRIKRRYPWTFKLATVQSLFSYQPQHITVRLDGDTWYDDRSWIVVVANGRFFGHGMEIAPDAKINDGLLDVILIEDIPRLTAIRALNTVYSGKHIHRSDVHVRQAKEVIIESKDGPLSLDLDGEYAAGQHLVFSVKPGALQMLIHGKDS